MPEPYGVILGRLTSNYTLAIGISVLLAGMMVYARLRHQPSSAQLTTRSSLDLYILLLIAALIVGRAVYVLTHFDYYGVHPQAILQFSQGGIDWHGVVWSSVLVIWLFARWKNVPFPALLNTCATALPIVMFGAWWGCHAASCSYGAEVQNMSQYPSWLVWEGPDIYGLQLPRFYTQSIGTILAFALFVLELLLSRLPHFRSNRFALVLILMSLSMFGIGFLRGDAVLRVANLRADQWLDGTTLLFALVLLLKTSGTASKTGYDSATPSLAFESD